MQQSGPVQACNKYCFAFYHIRIEVRTTTFPVLSVTTLQHLVTCADKQCLCKYNYCTPRVCVQHLHWMHPIRLKNRKCFNDHVAKLTTALQKD